MSTAIVMNEEENSDAAQKWTLREEVMRENWGNADTRDLDYEIRKNRRNVATENKRRQGVIKNNDGPSSTKNQNLQMERRRKSRSESLISAENIQAALDRTAATATTAATAPESNNDTGEPSSHDDQIRSRRRKPRPKSAAAGGNRKRILKKKNKKKKMMISKKMKAMRDTYVHRTVDTLHQVNRGRDGGDVYIYTGSTDVAQLRRKFAQDVAYHTMPWTPQAKANAVNYNVIHDTTTAVVRRPIRRREDGSPLAQEYMDRSAGTPQQLVPLFDQWLISPSGAQYKRQASMNASDFVAEIGKQGLLGSHDTQKL